MMFDQVLYLLHDMLAYVKFERARLRHVDCAASVDKLASVMMVAKIGRLCFMILRGDRLPIF